MRTVIVAMALAIGAVGPAAAATIVYDDFSSTAGLQLNGDAAAVNDGTRNVLRVTPAQVGQSGSAFSTGAITLSADYSFSTKFRFNINNQDAGFGGADGLVFVVQTNSNSVGGGGIGYEGITNSIGIEFDNFDNSFQYGGPTEGEPDGNHVGINVNGSVVSEQTETSPFALDSGTDLFAWIDYNGATGLLEVRLNDQDSRPGGALLSYTFAAGLDSILGTTSAFVGFTSGTGSGFANHDLVSWEFRDTFAPIVDVPEPASLAIVGAGLFGWAGLRRRRRG